MRRRLRAFIGRVGCERPDAAFVGGLMTKPLNPLQARLKAGGLRAGTPAYQIVAKAGLTPGTPGSGKLFTEPESVALKKLMKSFYDYGRANGWEWISGTSKGGAEGGLVLGKIKSCACGTFNLNFKWLAESALDIDGIKLERLDQQFLTTPPAKSIDKSWTGNVISPTGKPLSSFKFSSHFWVSHGGKAYDVCFNTTFAGTAFVWTKLLPPEPEVVKQTSLEASSLYKLQKPQLGADYLAMAAGPGKGGWPIWRLYARNNLPKK
jgi:hypothetical protein